jgi:hypothetical protein
MDVFLVPVGPDRYELYCEEPDDAPPEAPPSGLFRRLVYRFNVMLAEAERERRQASTPRPGGSLVRVRRRIMRWVAESIAEQRLLWQLRRRSEATLVYPADLSDPHARTLLRRHLSHDFERHRFWLAIDSLGLVGSAALVLVPGPNVVAYYFAFRMVGHFLSVRGARQGIRCVTWAAQESAPLAELRTIVRTSPQERAARVDDVAQRLRLEHFARFFQRIAVP